MLSAMLVAQCVGDLGCMVADYYCLVRWLAALVLQLDYEYGSGICRIILLDTSHMYL